MVKGLDRLNRRWKAIPKAAKINVRAAMENSAQDIVDEMQSRVAYRTGTAQVSINWTWGDAPKGTMTIGTVGGKDYGRLRITIYAGGGDAFYARFLEFGTIKMPSRPFFYSVWRASRRRVRGRITRAMSKTIRASKSI